MHHWCAYISFFPEIGNCISPISLYFVLILYIYILCLNVSGCCYSNVSTKHCRWDRYPFHWMRMNTQTCNSLSDSSQISTLCWINNEKDMPYNAVAFYIHVHISVDYLIGWHFAKGLGLYGLSPFLQCQFFSC